MTSFPSCLWQQTPFNVRIWQYFSQFCLGTGRAALCLCSFVHVYSQFSAYSCQIKCAYINKEGAGGGWGKGGDIHSSCARPAPICWPARSLNTLPTVFHVTVWQRTKKIKDNLAAFSDATASQKAKHETTWASCFLLFKKKKKKSTPTNLPLHHCPKLLLLLQSVAPKNNKIPSVFSWASSPARQKDFRT